MTTRSISVDLAPMICVVLPTRNRGDRVVAVIEAIARGSFQDFEIRVVDQSTQAVTATAVRGLPTDSRVHYHSSTEIGLARALNLGVASTTAELIAATGDDCLPAPDWLERIAHTFATHPSVTILHGDVRPAPHDPTKEFVQASTRPTAITETTPSGFPRLVGTSANMSFRRATAIELGGFDPQLGVGAPLGGGEDVDFVLRALARGWAVREDPAIRVTHLDAMPIEKRSMVLERNWQGTGAVIAKFVRCHPGAASAVVGRLARRWVSPSVGVSSSLGGGRRWQRLAAFARGFAIGCNLGIDRATGLFRPRDPR
jgi:GT2 family glycosyltransferase